MKTRLYAYFKVLLFAVFSMFLCGERLGAQCISSFTYVHSPNALYTFTNTSADTAQPTWYVKGPNLVYVSNDTKPSFYFPVNGTYYINLSSPYCQYVIDSIVVSGLNATGNCHAAMNYYPTYATNFEFDDASAASDSIINYSWTGFTPPDSFIVVNGWTKNTDLSLWSYNGCVLPEYIVTHSITTVTGCQSSITDTVQDYCLHCGASIEPGIIMHYDSLTHQLVFTDTVSSGQIGYKYWRFGTADNNTVFSTADSPVFSSFSDTLHVVCLDVYDTANHCTSSVCDSITAFIATGVTNIASANPQVELVELPGSLQIRYANIELSGIEIYDMLGKRILTSRIYTSPAAISLPPMATGIYFARMMAGDNSICRKFFVR